MRNVRSVHIPFAILCCMTTHTGSCHCGLVKYEFDAELKDAITCNCSHCHRKGMVLTFVPKEDFRLQSGAEAQSEYFFNKKSIRHLFCRTCGVQSYAEGIAFPQIAINLRCVEGVDIEKLSVTPYNGKEV